MNRLLMALLIFAIFGLTVWVVRLCGYSETNVILYSLGWFLSVIASDIYSIEQHLKQNETKQQKT